MIKKSSSQVHDCIGSSIQNNNLIYKIKNRSIINQRHDGTHIEQLVTYGLKMSRKNVLFSFVAQKLLR